MSEKPKTQPGESIETCNYSRPEIIVELDLETSAGSPLGPNPLDILGLDS